MSNSWDSIIGFWNVKYGLSINALNKGATKEELNILESYIGHRFPEAFKSIYKTHNGCEDYIIHPHPSRLLSTEEILNQWDYLNQIYSNYLGEELELEGEIDSKEVKYLKWNKNWIPFTICTRGRDFYCLDFDPTKQGKQGQIIFYSMDMHDRTFVAHSFKHWMHNMYHTFKI